MYQPTQGQTIQHKSGQSQQGHNGGGLPSHLMFHRGVAFSVHHERNGARLWRIFPADGPIGGSLEGSAVANGKAGSFKNAVEDAKMAINEWLTATTPQET